MSKLKCLLKCANSASLKVLWKCDITTWEYSCSINPIQVALRTTKGCQATDCLSSISGLCACQKHYQRKNMTNTSFADSLKHCDKGINISFFKKNPFISELSKVVSTQQTVPAGMTLHMCVFHQVCWMNMLWDAARRFVDTGRTLHRKPWRKSGSEEFFKLKLRKL